MTAVSEYLRDVTVNVFAPAKEIDVVPNFIDPDRWAPGRATAQASCFSHGGTRMVLHVSNFRPVKRVPAVVEVFSEIRNRVNARLLLVGEGPDLPMVHQRIQELGLRSSVEILGEQEQLVPLLSEADLFLLPSSQESFGLAALEAMACGVPVVASRVGGLPEVIDHGRSGFLLAPDDLAGMAAASIALLTDPALHAQIAAAGRRTVEQNFCADKIVPIYEAYYEEVLRRR